MSFSYGFGSNPTIDYPRFLVADTVEFSGSPEVRAYIFEDSEITMAYQIAGSFWQSSQFYSGPGGRTLPSTPVNYYRVAATLLDAIASSKARVAGLIQLLDVKLSSLSEVAKGLRDQAAAYRDIDDNSGSFVIIEQVNDQWAFRERFWNQVARQQGIGS